MPLFVHCPRCQAAFTIEAAPGKRVRCGACRLVFQVGEPPAVLPPPLPAAPAPIIRAPARPAAAGPATAAWIAAALAALVLLGLFGVGLALSRRLPEVAPALTEDGADGEGPPAAPTPPGKKAPPPSVRVARERVVRPLPAPAADLAAGGAGRYLVLHLPGAGRLAIFDVTKGEIARLLDAPGGRVPLAAGQEALVVALNDRRVLQRWRLADGTLEAERPFPFAGTVKSLVLGPAAHGPLLVHRAAGPGLLDGAPIEFLDAEALAPLTLAGTGGRPHFNKDVVHLRASADGRVFGLWASSLTPPGVASITVRGGAVSYHYKPANVGHVVPGPDGRALYTGNGVFTPQGTRVRGMPSGACVPGFGCDAIAVFHPARKGFRPPDDPAARGLAFHRAGDYLSLFLIPDLALPPADAAADESDLTLDKRVHVVPAARRIVLLPPGNDQLVLYPFDLDGALERTGADYLVVASRPPDRVRRGTTFRYPVVVKSRRPAAVSLASGPAGVRVEDGVVTWDVPADAPPEVDVALTVRGEDGQEQGHTFTLSVVK